jgi:hypothetical protein
MKHMIIPVLCFVLLAGCASTADQTEQNLPVENETTEQENTAAPTQDEQQSTSTSGPDCYGPEIHPVGQSIADQFEDYTDYDQVMVWFCNGAQFDDILTALQTEVLSGISVDDLLEMLDSGQTWNQIWVEIGLTEE